MTFAFYVTLRDKRSNPESSIKFGSYDPIALKEGSQFTILHTVDTKSWDLRAKHVKIGSNLISEETRIRFSP
jgi:hypothetical protein